jgi:hypothetical protein
MLSVRACCTLQRDSHLGSAASLVGCGLAAACWASAAAAAPSAFLLPPRRPIRRCPLLHPLPSSLPWKINPLEDTLAADSGRRCHRQQAHHHMQPPAAAAGVTAAAAAYLTVAMRQFHLGCQRRHFWSLWMAQCRCWVARPPAAPAAAAGWGCPWRLRAAGRCLPAHRHRRMIVSTIRVVSNQQGAIATARTTQQEQPAAAHFLKCTASTRGTSITRQ